MRKTIKREKGITLVALVITIIIIIILATVTLNFAFGDNGLIKRAEDARDYYTNSAKEEAELMSNLEEYWKSEINGIGFKEIAADYVQSLAIDEYGNLWGWGNNEYGQLGIGSTELYKTTPVQIKDGTRFEKICSGQQHSLAIDEDGNLWAWGYNEYGQLGDGTTEDKLTPVQIKVGTKFKEIYAELVHSLAIDEYGNLWAWGYNGYGQFGDGTTEDKLTPIQIKDGTKFKEIAAGEYHSLAIDEAGNLWTWGYNESGQLGNGNIEEYISTPVQIKIEN